jgi:hypothetical protein
MPALPLDEAGKYVAGAYVVFFTLIVVYASIIGAKIARIDRELGELIEIAEQDGERPGTAGATTATDGGSPEPRDGEPVDGEPVDGEPVA